jgi:hypothetical protein
MKYQVKNHKHVNKGFVYTQGQVFESGSTTLAKAFPDKLEVVDDKTPVTPESELKRSEPT